MDDLKRKLRNLKKFEARIRFGNMEPTGNKRYIWSQYFSTRDAGDPTVKYNLNRLSMLSREQLREVFNEYFYHVYYQYYKENGIIPAEMYDITLLSRMGLPPDSTLEDIKSRFRELAKKYHPDLGGDSSKFIELMETYNKLLDKYE